MNRRQIMVLAMVVSILFVDELLYSLIIPLVPYFTHELHISSAMTGVLFSSYPVAALIVTPFFGLLADRIGRKKPIMIGLMVLFLSTILFAVGQSVTFLIASRVIQGISSAATWGPALALLADVFPARMRGRAMGMAFTGISTGTLLGAPFGGFLFEIGGYKWPFVVAAILALLNLFIVVLWMPEGTVEDSQAESRLMSLLKDPAILFVGGVIFLASITLTLLDPLLPMLLGDEFGLNSLWIGVFFGVMTLAYAVASPISGAIADRYSSTSMMYVGLGVIVLSLPLMAVLPKLSLVVAMMILAGAGIGGALSPTMAALGNAVDRSGMYGSAYALSNMIFMVGMIVGPLLGGSLADLLTVPIVLFLLALIILIFILTTAGFIRKSHLKS